jgi:tRNA-Thr(GGU) m(6)t(6)A37 methyltransferase TsaA
MKGKKMLKCEGGFTINPIGIVRVDYDDELVKTSLKGVRGVIEIYEEYSKGLEGMDGFSHLILIAYLHKVGGEERKTLLVTPRRFIHLGVDPAIIPTVGVFCTDSPHRPNPIAITIVKLLKVKGRWLSVDGLDLFDSTPLIDIKPYTKARVEGDLSIPKWYSELLNKVKDKHLEEYDL